jgi:outer membrane protein OmpA-like peptidoglycan-associated protein
MMRLLSFIGAMAFCSSLPIADQTSFGTKDPGLLSLKGTIYFLSEETTEMPADIEKMKAQGVVYTDMLDIPLREFTEGFPGITNRFEWFGLMYTGTFEIAKRGVYKWKLESDDGSRLWIDGREIINNDGVHGMNAMEMEQELEQGRHAIKVWYFQGPATELGLRLFISVPGDDQEKIFSLKDFSGGVSEALKDLQAVATPEGIRVQMDAQILFDTNKFELKPAAAPTLKSLARIIASHPGCLVKVEGHTDNVGSEEANQKLSENRALAVKEALLKANLPANIRFETIGYGKSRPVADNNTEKGRAKNRRVEILIIP